ncbi:MAG: hypothetical protein ABIV48_10745 [Pyrinomonadaceae bacterium]
MNNLRAFGFVVLVSAFFAFPAFAKTSDSAVNHFVSAEQTQQIVESVDFQGNRRLRDEDLL